MQIGQLINSIYCMSVWYTLVEIYTSNNLKTLRIWSKNMTTSKWINDGYIVTDNRDIRSIRRVLIVTMVLNFLATGIKLFAGISTGMISLIADGLDSLFDGISNLIGIIGIQISGRPPDIDYPYGHRKFETIAALSISMLLFLTSWQLLEAAWSRYDEGGSPEVNNFTFIAILLSIAIQAGTSYYELRQGRRLKSEVLVADALHTRASILVSISVLVGYVFIRLGYQQADLIVAVLIALFIAKIGIDILRDTVPILVDQAAVDPHEIAKIVESVEGVESFHRVRSRGAEGSAAVDLHIRVSPVKTVQEADAIGDEVRRRLLTMDHVTDVTVHLEAQRDMSRSAADLFSIIRHSADGLGLTIHESSAHRIGEDIYVEIHVGVNPLLSLGEAHDLVDFLEQDIHQRLPQVTEVHTHIEMASKRIEEGNRVAVDLHELVQSEVNTVVSQFPPLAEPHNIIVHRIQGEETGYYVSMECTIAPETPIAEAHYISSLVEQELCNRLVGVINVFIHLEKSKYGIITYN
jgi:cation diffusion facilitator family transporter